MRASSSRAIALANPINIEPTRKSEKNLLPFLKITLHKQLLSQGPSGVDSFGLFDLGCTRNIISKEFYLRNFPNSDLHPTNVILKYAAEGKQEIVEFFSELYVTISVEEGTLTLFQLFLSVPNIRFDVYLG